MPQIPLQTSSLGFYLFIIKIIGGLHSTASFSTKCKPDSWPTENPLQAFRHVNLGIRTSLPQMIHLTKSLYLKPLLPVHNNSIPVHTLCLCLCLRLSILGVQLQYRNICFGKGFTWIYCTLHFVSIRKVKGNNLVSCRVIHGENSCSGSVSWPYPVEISAVMEQVWHLHPHLVFKSKCTSSVNNWHVHEFN